MTTTTDSPPSGDEQDGSIGTDYAAFFQKLVDGQEARKTSLESRGITVITTSGALVTLLFALVALLTKSQDFKVPHSTHWPLGVALVAFVTAAVFALITNLPRKYTNLDPGDSDALLDRFAEPADKARLRIAATNLRFFKRAQEVNESKARILIAAMAMEIAGVGAVAVSVAQILRAG
jgi:hypothetical protein